MESNAGAIAISEARFTDVRERYGEDGRVPAVVVGFAFEKAYSARYVRYTFIISAAHNFIDELEVYADSSKTSVEPKEEEPVVIKEEITVDGKVDDTGWAEDGWTEVTPENGTVQEAETENDTLSYKFQMRTDDTNLYVAFVIDAALIKSADTSKSACTNTRLWIHNDNEYAQYTHFFDVWAANDGSAQTLAKYNTVKDANSGANIENSTLKGAIAEVDGKTVVEMSVAISEFAKEGQTEVGYFTNVANTVNKQYTLLYPQFPIGEEDRGENMPYKKWYTEGEGKIDLAAIKLGEITQPVDPVDPGTPTKTYEDEIKEKVGPATGDAQFEVTLTAPKNYKAGETVEVVATVNKITNQNGLASIEFEFSYDTAKFELVSEKNADGSFKLDATVPAIWENLTRPSTEEGKQVVTFTNASNAEDVIKEDGKLVFKFILKAKADATGEAGAWIVNESVRSVESDLKTAIPGNGSYVILTPEEAQQSSTESKPATGDGSLNVIVLAIVALVAVAGVAVVIKTRR